MDRPERLPGSFARVWEVLAEADGRARSRRELAGGLRISTHTLQRILRDGDVPDLSQPQSAYVTGSWARTLTRIACGLGLDPVELVRSTGLVIDSRIAAIIDSGTSAGSGVRRDRDPAPDLAGFLSALLAPSSEGGRAGPERRLLLESLRSYLTATGAMAPGLADSGELESGRFCRSCMTSLGEESNRGSSDRFCRWCSDRQGNLRPASQVREILTDWFMHWQKGISREEASRRAGHYMLAMPAWAHLDPEAAAGAT